MIKIIEENNIIDYYQNFMKNDTKNTKDLLQFKVNPYIQRKERYKEFMSK
jgi:DNA integrity scanning protein DisA with diadenylate cyclase activity